MVPIFLASVTPYAGKNVVALGIARKLQREGKSVGYFKPIGPLVHMESGTVTDEDAVFFKKALGLDEDLATLCPCVLGNKQIQGVLSGESLCTKSRILDAFAKAAESHDAVVAVNMGRLSCGLSLGYPMHQFIRDAKAKLVIVDRYRWPVETLDGMIHMKELLPDAFAGVVFNRISSADAFTIEKRVRPFLKGRGIEVFGVLPNDVVLGAAPISDIVEILNATVLCAPDKLDGLVEHFSIGAMKADAALRVFQRVPHKGVITGGDRSDIQLAALQTSTRCIVLTGALHPNERILTQAEEQGVPVLLTDKDTSTTAELCERLHGRLSLNSERKIARVDEVLEPNINWDGLYAALGLA